MDLEDEERIARTRAVYMPALTNNEVRDLFDMGPAGIDAETGKVEDPALEEWGRVPFEQQSLPQPAAGMDGGSSGPWSARRSRPSSAWLRPTASSSRAWPSWATWSSASRRSTGPEDDPYQDPAR